MKVFSLRSCLLFISMAAGMAWPASGYTFLVKYAVMTMLFLSLLECRISPASLLRPRLWQLVAVMAGLAIASFSLLHPISPDLALVAALMALTPTATAAPVVTRFLKGQVEYVVAAVLLTNGLMALAIPLTLALLPVDSSASVGQILNATLGVIVAPLLLAQLLRHWAPGLTQQLRSLNQVAFALWLLALYLAASKASEFIGHQAGSPLVVGQMAGIALASCALNFGLGRWLGGTTLAQENGQALGQKNTLFAIWLCLTFFPPHLALGPMFYILFQNVYNSYLIGSRAS